MPPTVLVVVFKLRPVEVRVGCGAVRMGLEKKAMVFAAAGAATVAATTEREEEAAGIWKAAVRTASRT